MPLVAGVGCEILWLTGRSALAATPGTRLRRFTIWEPDDVRVEVAGRALRGVVDAAARLEAPML